MSEKIKKLSKYLLYIIITNLIYGVLLWYICTWLAKYSMVYAYLGNIVMIILGLLLDEIIPATYRSRKFTEQLKQEKNLKENLRIIRLQLDNFISFKTALYLFYILILVIAQIREFAPDLITGNLRNFILATEYSILLLVAFDALIKQFYDDRKRIEKIATEFWQNFF